MMGIVQCVDRSVRCNVTLLLSTKQACCYLLCHLCAIVWDIMFNRLALKSGIDGHLESPQVGHSRPANTSQR